MKKNRNKIFLAILVICVFVSSWSLVLAQYTNQEKIPGAQPTQRFDQYLKGIINFGFATIGILALWMIVIGAYQYLMAAGNIGKVDSAKETIGSAVFGLILGLCAWIILNKINPDLVRMELKNISGLGGGTISTGSQNYSAIAVSGTTKEKIAAYQSYITAASQQYNVPENVIKAVIDVESSGNALAKNPNSSASGLMQLTSGTAASLGVTNPLDPVQSIDGGTRYLSQMYAQTGSWDNAVAAYYLGLEGFRNKTGGNWQNGGSDVQSYVTNVMGKTQSYT